MGKVEKRGKEQASADLKGGRVIVRHGSLYWTEKAIGGGL